MKRKPEPKPEPQPSPVPPPLSSAPVTFRATIPPMETAIKIHGEGGARMQLDIAESDLGGFLPALVMRGRVLMVTLTAEE
jgi:hypothetical protein